MIWRYAGLARCQQCKTPMPKARAKIGYCEACEDDRMTKPMADREAEFLNKGNSQRGKLKP